MPPRKRKADDEDAARQRERQQIVVSRMQNLDADGTLGFLDTVTRRWKLDRPGETSYQRFLETAFENFGVELADDMDVTDLGSFGLRQLDERMHEHEMELITLYHKLREHRLLEGDVLSRMMTAMEQVFYAKRAILNIFQAKLAVHQLRCGEGEAMTLDADLDKRLGSWSLRFRWIDGDTSNAQKLLLHMLDRAMEKRYRRQGGSCMEPIVVRGHATHAWRCVLTIKDWLYQECPKETNWEQWSWLTSSGAVPSHVIEHLTSCIDYSFPQLHKDRSTFSFANGIYRARYDAFYPYDGEDTLADSIASCKFFDLDFPEGPEDPATPFLDSIMEFQGWEPAVREWLYVLMGRLLYDVGDLDGWQVIPFFKGLASSGKSTLVLKVAKQFYDEIDCGVMSNNIEKKFGLSQFHDKLLFLAPEIKSDLQIEQAEFQSMVSGEDITIAIKGKTAIARVWKAPGVLAGNEVPGWVDNSGSIQRRVVLFDFARQVTNGDMKLGDKLATEIPAILVRCNRAYLRAARDHGAVNIWTVLPQYFLRNRDEMAQSTNVLEAFLTSDDVVLRADAFCSLKDFKDALKTFSHDNNFAITKRFSWEWFRGPMEKFGVVKAKEAREYRGRALTAEFLQGVDLARLQDPTNEM